MARNKLSDLRDHLFATLEALRDDEKPMDIERAKAVSEVAQTVINSAKVELQYLELVGQEPAGVFFDVPFHDREALPPGKANGKHREDRGLLP